MSLWLEERSTSMIQELSKERNVQKNNYVSFCSYILLRIKIDTIRDPRICPNRFQRRCLYFGFNFINIWRVMSSLPPSALKPKAVKMNMRYRKFFEMVVASVDLPLAGSPTISMRMKSVYQMLLGVWDDVGTFLKLSRPSPCR
jgi:hypothetical protein